MQAFLFFKLIPDLSQLDAAVEDQEYIDYEHDSKEDGKESTECSHEAIHRIEHVWDKAAEKDDQDRKNPCNIRPHPVVHL